MILCMVAYDISSPKRWRQVHKTMQAYGARRQWSVFEVQLSEAKFVEMRAKLEELIDQQEDRLLILPICRRCHSGAITIGCHLLDPDQRYIVA